MNRIIFATVVLMAALAAHAQTAPPPSSAPDAPVLTKLLNDFLAGAGRNDVAMHDRFWADDLIYTSATGTRRGKPEIMRGLRNPPRDAAAPAPSAPATVYTAEDVRIQQYGDTAIVAFRLVATPAASAAPAPSSPQNAAPNTAGQAPPPTVQRFFNTGTFLKRNGEWRAVAWQATRIPAPDAPRQ